VKRTLLMVGMVALAGACGPKASSAGGTGGGAAGPDDPPVGASDTVRSDAQMTGDLLAQVHDALGCPHSSHAERAFCAAADGWDKGEAAPLPATPSLLVGLSVSLPENDPVDKALEQTVRFAALGVRGGDGPLARIVSIDPSNPDEQKLVDAALAATHAFWNDGAASIALPKDLADYLADLPSAGYKLTKGAHGWTWKSGATHAELRKVGDTWVAIEVPLKGDRGLFVSVFTPKLK
jgi:hypothetical protein